MQQQLNQKMLVSFREELIRDEKSEATVEKYLRDLKSFVRYGGEEPLNKELVVRYKQSLTERYAPVSVNSMLAAVNRFLKWLGRGDCTVKSLKIQPRSFRERELTREEYYRLLRAAKEAGKERLWLLLQTVGTTGIRISELRFITVEAVGQGSARVRLKGKNRRVLLPGKLCGLLRRYAKGQGIRTGSIFITHTGRPLDRSNILHEMKALCPLAQVEPEKVFPHNLRHLFACLYYNQTKDLCHLADVLGHSNINTTRLYTTLSTTQHLRQLEHLRLLL